ncbi:MAG: hypothetical protein ACLQU3_30970 [Limisphaerales bacterium]
MCALAVPLLIAGTTGICPTKVQAGVCFQGFPAGCNAQTPPGGSGGLVCLYVPTDTNYNWGCTGTATNQLACNETTVPKVATWVQYATVTNKTGNCIGCDSGHVVSYNNFSYSCYTAGYDPSPSCIVTNEN